jgi:PAS domain S-box-containing protein
MTPGIDKDGFDRQIEITYQKLDGLLRRMSISGQETTVASEALEELSTTLEELHVVSDELSRQNTELAAAHLVAQAERQRYQDLFDFAPDGYLVTDTNGVIREANRAAADLLHVAQELLVGKPLAVYVAENERKAFRDILSTLLKRSISGANEWEITLRPRGGLEVKVSITVTPVVPVSTSPLPALGPGIAGVGLRWSLRDITESQRAAERERLLEELRQANRLLQTLLETMPVGVTVCDPDGSIRMLNPTGRKILGGMVTGSMRSPQKNFELLHPDGSLVLAEHFPMVRALEAKELTDNEEFIVRRADGSELTVMASAAPVLGAGGELLGGVTIFQDHSGRKRAEEQVASLAKFPSENPNPVLRVGGKGILLYANPASQMLLDEWQTAVDQPLPEFWQTILAGVENEKREVEVESSELVFSFTVCPVPETDYINLYGRDITAVKRAGQALRKHEADLSGILDATQESVWMFDTHGSALMANATALSRLQLSAAEVIGQPFSNYLSPELAQSRLACLQKVVESEAPLELEDERAGIIFHHRYYPIKAGDGAVERVVSFSQDITQSRQADEALQRTSQRFYNVLANMYTGLLLVTDDDRVEFANQAFCDYFGVKDTPQALVGVPAAVILTKIKPAYLYPQQALQRIREIVELNVPVRGEELPMRDGRQLLRDFIPIQVDGKSFGRLWYHTDITDRKRAEEALQESELKYRSLVQYAPAGIYEIDFRTGRFTEVNDAMCQILGYTREELLGMTASGIMDEAGKALFAERVRIAQTSHELPPTVEYGVISKDGRQIWGLLNITFKWEADRIVGANVIANDVTQRKLAEKALEDSQRSLQAVFNGVTETIMMMDLDGKILNANDTAARRWGTTVSNLIGKNGFGLTTPETRKKRMEQIRKLAETGLPVRFQDERGGVIFDLTFYPIKDALGKIGQFVVFGQDITERKRAELEAQKLLNQVQAEKDRLATLVNNITDEVWFADPCKNFTLANPAALREFQVDPDNGLEIEKFAASLEVFRADGTPRPIDEAPPLRALRGELVKNQEEIVRVPSSGQLRHREVNASPVRDPDGQVVGAISVVRDITERKQAEQALRESQRRYHDLFNTMDEGFCIVEVLFDGGQNPVDYRYLEVNPAFEKQTGLHAVEGKLMRTLVPLHETAWFEILGKIALTGEPVHFINEARQLQRWYEVYAYRMGKPEERRVAVIFNDISERKHSEQKLQATNDELKRFNMAMVGRELRMVNLKNEVNQLCKQAGLPPRYGKDAGRKPTDD